jgi:hypothetical protein
LIRFAEEIDGLIRFAANAEFSPSPSPCWLVAAMGWVVPLGIPVFVVLLR